MTSKEMVASPASSPGGALVEAESWDEFEDLMDDGTERIRPMFPEIKIVTATSTMDGAGKHGGEFWFSDQEGAGAFWNGNLSAVFLQAQYGRALFGNGSQLPLCSSADGDHPRDEASLWGMKSFTTKAGTEQAVIHDRPADCARCLFQQFTNGQPGLCRDSYLTLVFRQTPEFGPAQFRIGGTALRDWRKFNRARKGSSRGNGKIGLPLVAFNVLMWTEEISHEGKKWYQLIMEWERMPRGEIHKYATLAREYGPSWRDAAKTYISEDVEDVTPAGNHDGWTDGTASFRHAPVDYSPPAEDGDGWEDGD